MAAILNFTDLNYVVYTTFFQMVSISNLCYFNLWVTKIYVYNKLSTILNLRLTEKKGCPFANVEYKRELIAYFTSPDIYGMFSTR